MITVSVCIGSACHKRGSYAILNRFKQLVRQHGAEDKGEGCARVLPWANAQTAYP